MSDAPFRHPDYTHEHPGRTLALRTRTPWFGTWNFAVAMRGRSCGWGTCARPRRWFIGHHAINRRGGRHFVELVRSP